VFVSIWCFTALVQYSYENKPMFFMSMGETARLNCGRGYPELNSGLAKQQVGVLTNQPRRLSK
jgi:hypothetical protein